MIPLLLFALAAGGPAQTPTPTPTRPPDVDLVFAAGLVSPDEPVSHDFEVENDTDQEVRVVDHRSGCGCISLGNPSVVLPPRGRAAVRVRLDPRKLYGAMAQSVVLSTTHPTKPVVRLTIRCTVRSVWAYPGAVDLGAIDRGQTPRQEVGVFAAGLPGTRVLAVKVGDPTIATAELRPADTTDETRNRDVLALGQLVVTWAGASLPPGGVRTEVVLTTNNEKYREIRVPVTAHVTGSSQVTPSQVLFGAASPGQALSREVTVRTTAPVTAADLKLVCEHPFVSATVKEVGADGRRVVLDVRLTRPAAAADGVVRGRVTGSVGPGPVFSFPYTAIFLR